MKIIGLTGGSGSGKGMAGKLFSALGCSIIDTDRLYHDMIEADSPCSRAIIERFGKKVQNDKGGIARACLADIVFDKREELATLNSIAHTFIRAECDKLISSHKEAGTEILIIDAPQLFEAGMQDICDATVAVVCEKQTRIKRICSRDGISTLKASARIAAQISDAFFVGNCDFIIENNSDAAHLLLNVKKVLDKIKDLK